ncbi:hypothetical protein [Mucilaginibacter achroorhodeus]|uniref:hypothetical protein n=1 Tax=Mucilaginibacter achroorhodeus TaxID=2599294 RepID=UPI00164871F6|nr:hypothetical protein [Mucilaginibacter achroorhodeus]
MALRIILKGTVTFFLPGSSVKYWALANLKAHESKAVIKRAFMQTLMALPANTGNNW